MIVLVPMGGFGSRFLEAGYTQNKPSIPTFDRHSGEKVPMIVAALKDIPGVRDPSTQIICVNRDFHAVDGTEASITHEFPGTIFIHDHVLLDQAFACLLAREFLSSDEELIIAACDCGMSYSEAEFVEAKSKSDALMISHSNDDNISANPYAHSWAKLDESGEYLTSISIKKPVSDDYMCDHATTGMFWYRRASDFLNSLEIMLNQRDMILSRTIVDEVLQISISSGLRVSFFDVKYLCWGTPEDLENYHQTVDYWRAFHDKIRLY